MQAGQLAPDAGIDVLPWRAGAALAHLRNGDARAAGELARAHVELARQTGSPYAMAGALRALAAVDAGPDRVQHLLRARAVLAGSAAERLSAQIDTDLAGLLLLTHAADAEERALALLRSAEDHAGRQELWPLQGRVRRLLDRLGEPAPQGADRGDGRTHRLRAAGRPDGRRRAHQPADRQRAGGDGQGGRVAPLARLPQARHLLADQPVETLGASV